VTAPRHDWLPPVPQRPQDPADPSPVTPPPQEARPASPPPTAGAPGSWPLWSAFAALLCGLLGGNVLGMIVYAVAGVSGDDLDTVPIGYMLLANVTLDASLLISALAFARLGGRVVPATLGLRPVRLWFAVKWAFAAYVAYFVISAIWLQVLNLENETDDITDRLQTNPTVSTVAGIAVFAVVIAPIVEEVFFRGFVFPALRAKLGVAWAAVGTGLLFGLVHALGSPIGFLLPLAVLGTALCLLYWRTGSIYPGIALHAINNCIALSAALDWGWQVPLLILGALGAIAAILLPVSRVRGGLGALARPVR
jgi:uncharacterized protein